MKRYLSTVTVLLLLLSAVLGWHAGPAAAASDIGYRDFQFGASCNSTPTGEKPESKLWWNDGIWWGSLCATDSKYHIFRLDLATQSWADTGVLIDDRGSTKADTLWDQARQKLYVASHTFTSSGAPTNSSSSWGRLYRYSYSAAAKTYSLDSGFPVTVTRGKSETLVLAKDSTCTLWVTYVESSKVMVNHSAAGNCASSDNPDERSWGIPYVLPVAAGAANLSSDDISANITFDTTAASPKVGVLWSNQNDKKMYFASHTDGTSDTAWSSFGVYVSSSSSPAAADDHINIKLQSDGVGVYAVTKTSNSTSSQPLIMLLSCTGGCDIPSSWSATTVYSRGDNHTRPILLIDTTHNLLNVFSTTPESGGNIYRKTSPINNISFAPGHGDLFIKTSGDLKANNPTSTKQNVNSTTGLVVLASDQNSRYYLHNYDALGGSPPPPAGPTANFSASPTSGVAPLAVQFADTSTGSPTTWAWDFGDGAISSVPSPSHSYSAAGSYTVKLTVSNAGGSNTATKTSYISVSTAGSARIKDMTFESGALVNATNGVDSVSGSVALASTQTLQGAYSARIAGAGNAYLQQSFSAQTNVYVSFLLRLDTLPSSDARIALISNAGTTVGNLVLRSNGALRLRDGSTTIGADSAPLAPGTAYRIGIHQKQGGGGNAILEAYLAPAGTAFGASFAATNSGTWTTAADRLRFGATTSSAVSATFDTISVDSLSMP